MGTCDDFVDLIMDFVDGELVGPQRQRLLQHLRECEHCSAQVHKLRLLRVQLRNLPRVATSPGFDTLLRARLRAQENARWRKVWAAIPFASWRVPAYALTLVVLALAALGALFLLRHGQQLAAHEGQVAPAEELAHREAEDSAVVVNYVLESVPIDVAVLGKGIPLATGSSALPSDSVERRLLVTPPAVRPRVVSF
ncbi:MAG: anti-sigma factor [candidate division KSB1 bacterium]|nr:anti-sigma factor [candidate division KSB1 bacterium]MDZ7293836.1 anti-sigma factor [candidate division KSB1 bacterium]MDZ7337840.1 anti-sigma factor [candidate division KSB1 bacterium]MDZ7377875.1 anti-sigma factor [candidate division KSB1 bacterium]MDZ7386671.1 anti-sigma factor [candidate division KSB1 bacterium]